MADHVRLLEIVRSFGSTPRIRHIGFSAFKLACPSLPTMMWSCGNAERARHLDDSLRHLDVGARGRRIAGGVFVHQPAARVTALTHQDVSNPRDE